MSDPTSEPEETRGELAAAAAGPLNDEIASLRMAAQAFQQAARDTDADPDILLAPIERCIAAAQKVLYVSLSGELPPPEVVTLPGDRDELLAAFADAIDSLIAHVQEADPALYGAVTWQHDHFGDLNWREWLVVIRFDLEQAAATLRT